jgi:hypothetical protein
MHKNQGPMYAASLCSLNRRMDEPDTLTIAGLESLLSEAAPVLILLFDSLVACKEVMKA